jgi:hypothetical protein
MFEKTVPSRQEVSTAGYGVTGDRTVSCTTVFVILFLRHALLKAAVEL